MRQARLKVSGVGVYHCMSRTVAGSMLFDDRAKSVLRKMIRKTAAFCAVEVLAHCVMTNHFHMLVRVDPVAVRSLGRVELLARYRAFFAESVSYGYPSPEALQAFFEADGEEARRWEERIRARMGDVSEFVKTLKQRFTIWYNKSHQRYGTLWAERFKSVLVEDTPCALQTVAAYIELNPVRAHLVEDPEMYPWCSYAEAISGDVMARSGISRVLYEDPEDLGSWRQTLAKYRLLLFCNDGDDVPRMDAEAVPLPILLRTRWQAMTNGLVLGGRNFVESVRTSLSDSRRREFEHGSTRHLQGGRVPSSGGDALITLRKSRDRNESRGVEEIPIK